MYDSMITYINSLHGHKWKCYGSCMISYINKVSYEHKWKCDGI